MGLQISRVKSRKNKLIITVMALFALVAQPMYGVVEMQIARAVTITDKVIINEIMANPLTGEVEWVELYNPTDTEVNMSDWRIRYDDTTNFSGLFSAGTTIAAKGYAVRSAASSTTSSLRDTSGRLRLQSADAAQTYDDVTYNGIADGKTYARTYDASGEWVAQTAPTKGTSNGAAPQSITTISVSTEDMLHAAIANQQYQTVNLSGDIVLSKQLTISRPLTLNGNGHELRGGFVKDSTSNNAVVGVVGANGRVTINNLKVHANIPSNNLHGFNLHSSNDVVLNAVTATNGNSGVTVSQGATATINGITTSDNRWYAINVDKAGASLDIGGSISHDEPAHIVVGDTSTDVTFVDRTNQYKQTKENPKQYQLLATLSTTADVNSEASLRAAIADPFYTTINFTGSFNVTKQITVTRPLTINGNGFTLMPGFTYVKDQNDNNAALGIIGTRDVTVNDLKIEGANGTGLHGINIFESQNISLNKITTKSNDKSGISVNASTVTITDVTTVRNGWHGINVDKDGAVATIKGSSVHTDELAPLYIDDDTKNVQIIDEAKQYAYVKSGHPNRPNDRVYTVKPVVIDTTAPSVPKNGTPNDKAIATNDFYFEWQASTDENGEPVTYEFQSSGTNNVDQNGSLANAWLSSRDGNPEQKTLTSPKIHSTGAPDGKYFWQARAIDSNGNKSAWSSVWNMTIDRQKPVAPTATVDGKKSGDFTKDVNVTLKWDKPSADIVKYRYVYWNAITGNRYKQNNPYTVEVSRQSQSGTFNQGEGAHYMQVVAIDAAGNESAPSNVFELTLDQTKPKDFRFTRQSNTENVQGAVVSGDETFVFAQSEANPKTIYIEYMQDVNGKWTKRIGKEVVNTNEAKLAVDTSKWADGRYQIKITTKDKAENATSATAQFTVKNATEPVQTAPTVTLNNDTEYDDVEKLLSGTFTTTGSVKTDQLKVNVYVNNSFIPLENVLIVPSEATAGEYVWIADLENKVVPGAQNTATIDVMVDNTKAASSAEPYAFTPSLVAPSDEDDESPTDTPEQPALNANPELARPPMNTVPVFNGVVLPTTLRAASSTPFGLATFFAPTPVAETDNDEDVTQSAVLGERDTTGNSERQLGAITAESVKDQSGFALAWYWWLLIVAAIVALGWFVAAKLRRDPARDAYFLK